jgi:hypothetical protein
MHFALLLSKLPHVEDARTEYSILFSSGSHLRRLRDIVITVRDMIRKVTRVSA